MAPNRAAAHSPAGSLPTTSSSGLLNDLEAGGRSNSFGQLYQQDESPDDMTTHREKNRLAQRKFRARQKEKMKTSQKQLDELTKRVSMLMAEKSQLETRNRILEEVVTLNMTHEQMLHCNTEIMAREQEILCEELAQFVNVLEGRTDLGVADAKRWTLKEWMATIFPKYIEKVKVLVKQGMQDPSGPALAELESVMSIRRAHEKRRALFSCFYWAVYSWNLEAMQSAGSPPGQATWKAMLDNLRLTSSQETAILSARSTMLDKLRAIGRQRRQLLSGLAMELLQTPQEEWPQCPSVQQLQKNLGQERAAVFTFMYSTCDETLTSVQEAILDTESYPWAPDIWQISCLLASARGQQDKGQVPDLKLAGPALASLLPHSTAFTLLTEPLMAQGLALKLKRGILKNPFQLVVPAAAFSTPSIKALENMSLFDVHCGGYRDIQFW
eukprot:jgi/Astpho2/1785/Aster-x0495